MPSAYPTPPAGWGVRRGALLAALDSGAWLTAIVAGPAAGKTSLLTAWARGRPTAWLTLGPEYAGLSVLRRGLADALGPAGSVPGAALDALGATEEVTGDLAAAADPYAHATGLASVLATAFDGAAGPELALVLDDAQHLAGGGPAARFVEELCRHAPPGLRLVISSRTELPFPVDRLRAAGRLTELGDEQLAFVDFETYQLLTLVLGDAAAADTLSARLHALTGGHPGLVALGAAWLAAQPADQRRDRLGALPSATAEALAGYLAHEVLATAEPDARELARRAAYLPRVSARLCRDLGLPADDPRRAVPLLAPVADAPGWYAVDAALRPAVLVSLPLPDPELQALLGTASRWYAQHGRLEDALAAAAAADSPDPVTELLVAHGSALLAAGRAADVIEAAARVPAHRRTPVMDLVEGEARHLRGDPAGALACLERLAAGDGRLAAGVAHRIGLIHQSAGDPAAALASFQRARLDDADPTDAALVLSQISTTHWLRGDLPACRDAAQRALAAANSGGGDRALAAAHTALALAAERAGDFEANAEHMTLAMAAAQRAGDLLQQIRLRINLSSRLLEEGRHADALVELDDAIRLIEATGALERYAVVRTNRGWAYRSMGRLDEAVAELDAAVRMWRAAGSTLLAYALSALGSVYLVRGDLARAEDVLGEALALGERTGDHQSLAGLSTLARVRYATDPPSARVLTERSIETGFGVWRAWALLTAGWLAVHDGDPAAAIRHTADAEQAAAARHDANAVAEALELRSYLTDDPAIAVELLRGAQARWARLGNPIFVARASVAIALRTGADVPAAEARLRALGVRPEAALAAGPLRAAGAFTGSRPAPFLPTARAGLDRFARGELDEAQRLLTDAVDGVPGGDALPGAAGATYLDALRALASASAVAGETDVALRWYLRLLEHDPNDEVGHLGAVITLARVGRHDEARRRYRAYSDRMRDAGAEPAPYPSEWTAIR
ncbi:MAG TPA: hypothetical protein VFE14_12010 [Micromonosporaceae bacterium]|nr:hypothetical protein [Micromonosporaceae bacterium]